MWIAFYAVFSAIVTGAVGAIVRARTPVAIAGFAISYMGSLVLSGMIGHYGPPFIWGSRYIDLLIICAVVAGLVALLFDSRI